MLESSMGSFCALYRMLILLITLMHLFIGHQACDGFLSSYYAKKGYKGTSLNSREILALAVAITTVNGFSRIVSFLVLVCLGCHNKILYVGWVA